jgi:hypothetical protein
MQFSPTSCHFIPLWCKGWRSCRILIFFAMYQPNEGRWGQGDMWCA